MKKPLLGLLLGGVLGVFDGLSALLSAPETAPDIVGIVIGSTMKGLLVGVLVGWFATRVRSMPLGLAFGLVVSAFFAWLVRVMRRPVLPGNHPARQHPRPDRRLCDADLRCGQAGCQRAQKLVLHCELDRSRRFDAV